MHIIDWLDDDSECNSTDVYAEPDASSAGAMYMYVRTRTYTYVRTRTAATQ